MTSKNKYEGIIGLALFVAAFFTATQPLAPEMASVSSIFVVIFALPSYYAVIRAKTAQMGFFLLGVLGLYALLLESSAIHTGFPYGEFIYNDLLGEKVFGLTPWTVAFAWPPILLLAYTFARAIVPNDKIIVGFSKGLRITGLTALLAMLIDLVLDPAAVQLGFWAWEEPGFYYGVPVVNFVGWLISGFVGATLLHVLWKNTPVPKELAYSGLAILWFWTWANLFMLQLLPFVVGCALLAFFFRKLRSIYV
jgi:bisanhydrobacterioruberin hydratase